MLINRWIVSIACLLLGSFASGVRADESTNSLPEPGYIVKPVENAWLSESSIIAMTQDHDGYLWLGTLNGLARFDGVQCTVFTEANTPELKSSPIVCLFEDSHSNLWVGTQTAGNVVIRKDGSVEPVRVPGKRLGSLAEDSNGNIWLNIVTSEDPTKADHLVALYRNGGVELLKLLAGAVVADRSGPVWLETDLLDAANSVRPYLVPMIAPAGGEPRVADQALVAVPRLDYLLASKLGGYWRLADRRIEKWSQGKLELELGSYPWTNVDVLAACEDNEGNLIVGVKDTGLFWFHGPGQVTHLSENDGLTHSTVLSLCMDREGVLWVGTDGGGLNSIRRRQFNILKNSKTIQSVCDDRQGGVWFANIGGKLYHADQEGVSEFGDSEGLPVSAVLRSVFVDTASNVWVGTGRGLFVKEGERFRWAIPAPPVSVLHEDRAGRIWVGTQAGLLCRTGTNWTTLDARQGLSANNVQAIADDAEGNVWIGTAGGGLNRYHDGAFTIFSKGSGLPSDTISALYVDEAGILWVGTAGGGLARFFKDRWTTYTTREGLSGNSISYLTEDQDGYLWIGSNAGLMRVARKSLNDYAEGKAESIWCRVYLQEDGLPTQECSRGAQPAAGRSVDGKLWFATIRGLVSVNPAELKLDESRPPVVIESVAIQGREQMTNELAPGSLATVIIPPGKELLEIRYTSLNLGAAKRAHFRYKLEGLETRWTDAKERRIAPFTNLRPGHYVFHVIACNEDGAWNEAGAKLTVIVLPPFWQTWWFITVNAVVLLGLIVAVVRYVSTQKLHRQLALLRQQEALEKERARIARDLHDQLGANLTQVTLLAEMAESDKDQPEEVESHAQQICQTARETTQALDEIVWAANPANDTLDSLITYSVKYAQDYLALAGVAHRIEVPAEVPAGVIAPEVRHNVYLAFKEAVNNVVKHAQAKAVSIRLRLDSDRFTLEIEDDGRGLANPAGKPGRNGLRNMRKRLEDAGGRFEIGPAAGQGTLVRLTAPIKQR